MVGVGIAGYLAAELLAPYISIAGKSPVEPVALAVLLGLVLRNAGWVPSACDAGIRGYEAALKIGIVLLGISLSFLTVLHMGAVVIITGQVARGLVEQAAELGAFAYVAKPFEGHELEAAITIAFAQYSRIRLLQDEVGSLHEALEARKLVERAKGILMDRFGLAEGDAMRRLQQESKDRNLKLVEVARALVTAHETFTALDQKRKPNRRHSLKASRS
jgi:hypothetical protein